MFGDLDSVSNLIDDIRFGNPTMAGFKIFAYISIVYLWLFYACVTYASFLFGKIYDMSM